jgi:hypothetical protein
MEQYVGGLNTPKISIIYATCRPDYPMVDMPEIHQFTPFLESLKKQTFTDFEVIFTDFLHSKRKYDFSAYPFKIKHIDPSSFSWAWKKGLWALQDGFNYGLIHAEGELILWFGDCCMLPNSDALQIWWDWYKRGYFAMALALYYTGNSPTHLPDGTVVRDSRWNFVDETANGIWYAKGQQYSGYAASSLQSMIEINGYDSNFDGSSALSDTEAGERLEQLGYKFVCDKRLTVIERAHTGISIASIKPDGTRPSPPLDTNKWIELWGMPDQDFRSNYSLLILNKEKRRIRANDYNLTEEELKWIVEHGEKWGIPAPIKGTYRHKLLMEWFNNPPLFDIYELRKEKGF